ncbi:MAG: RNA pseudouridine synthase [Candidatus Pacebacteria bacterium]|nr:RNA pseudouridine synthase [Candidatus Paceibacterota bacterium]
MKNNNQSINSEQNKKSNTKVGVRINKYLALKKISTRRGADLLIKEKKVYINKKLAVLGSQVNENDIVEVKGAKPTAYKYYAYYKPKGTETSSPKEGLFPLGRLDKASHGLMILTNDGRITDQLLNPKYFHEKEYIVRTKEKLRSNFKQKMEAGVNIEGYVTKPCKVKTMSENTFKVILTEGKKHQIRRMCSNLFQEVADLKRERIMNIKLNNLKPNTLREIKGEELAIFLNSLSLTN